MAQTNLAFTLGSALATGQLTDSQYVKGGYITVATKTLRNALPKAGTNTDGIIIKGSMVYVQEENKLYKYTGTGTDGGFEEFQSGNSGIKSISFTDEAGTTNSKTPSSDGSIDLGNLVTSLANQNADNITEGVFDVERIPDLPASKISDFAVAVDKVLDAVAGKVSSDPASTPEGVTWKNASGTTITGTLSAADADKHLVYFVPKDIAKPSYNQYKVLSGQWIMIGTTGELDLSGYQHKLVTPAGVINESASNIILTDKSDGTTEIALANLIRLNNVLNAKGQLLKGSKILSFNGTSGENRLTIEAQSGLNAPAAATKNAAIIIETKALADGSKQSYINLSANSVYLGSIDNKILTAKNLTITQSTSDTKADNLSNVNKLTNATNGLDANITLVSYAKQSSVTTGYGSTFEASVKNSTGTETARIYLCGSEPADGKSVIELKADKVLATGDIYMDTNKVATEDFINNYFEYDEATKTLTIG